MEQKDCKSSRDTILEIDEREVDFSVNVFSKQKNLDNLLKNKPFLPYGVGPDVDCEIDDDSDEPNYTAYVLKKEKNLDYLLEKKIFLPYGVGPVIDCEIDDDSDEPDYLSYTLVPKVNLVEDSMDCIPGDAVKGTGDAHNLENSV